MDIPGRVPGPPGLDPPAIATATLAACPEELERWRANAPGAWGRLASQAVLLARARIDRRLDDAERRAIWQALWDALQRSGAT